MSKFLSFLLITLQIISTYQLNFKSFDIFKPNHIPYIQGHRGVNKEFPENTLRSFKNALDNNIDGIELDIWLSKDNVPVVVHGSFMGFLFFHYKRAFGFVRNYYLHELKQLEVRNGNDKMPTLEEVFQLCKGKLFINIEIKDGRYDKLFPVLIDLIKKYDMFDQISLSSFKHNYAKYVQEFNQKNEKKIEFGFLYGKKIIFDLFKYDTENTTINMYYSDVTKERCDKFFKICYAENNETVDDNVLMIKYMLYTAPSKYRDLILYYMPSIKIDDCAFQGGSQHFSPYYNTLTLDLTISQRVKYADGQYVFDYPCIDFFHEMGHGIDDVTDKGKMSKSSDELHDTLISDLKSHMTSVLKEAGYSLNKKDKKELFDFIISKENINVVPPDGKGEEYYFPKDWNDNQREAFKYLRKYFLIRLH